MRIHSTNRRFSARAVWGHSCAEISRACIGKLHFFIFKNNTTCTIFISRYNINIDISYFIFLIFNSYFYLSFFIVVYALYILRIQINWSAYNFILTHFSLFVATNQLTISLLGTVWQTYIHTHTHIHTHTYTQTIFYFSGPYMVKF